MTGPELTEEEVMNNDIDPIEALQQIRRDEGVPEEDIIIGDEDHATGVLDRDSNDEGDDGSDELAELAADTGDNDAQDDQEGTEAGDEDAGSADPDVDAAAGDDEGETSESEGDSESEGPKLLKFRANGQDFEFTPEEAIAQFETVFGQAANYTQKMQKISPYRKMISALESESISHEQLNLAIDALKGDKGAIKQLLEANKIDAYDLTSEDADPTPYVQKNYGKDETSLEIEEVISTIQNDEEFVITTNVIDEQWDSGSRQTISQNPRMILGLHADIQSGLYDEVAPAAMKMKVLDGNSKSDIEYYMIAGEQLRLKMEADAKLKGGQAEVNELNKDAQSADSKFDKASSQASRKRAASSTGARADRKGVIDYMDDDDEAFDEWYKNLESNI
jgi:hypothetical protein